MVSETQFLIWEYIRNHPNCTNYNIAFILDLNEDSVKSSTYHLKKRGLIHSRKIKRRNHFYTTDHQCDFAIQRNAEKIRNVQQKEATLPTQLSKRAIYVCQRILTVIREKNGCSIDDFVDLIKDLQIRDDSFRRYLRLLKRRGLIEIVKLQECHERDRGRPILRQRYFLKGSLPDKPICTFCGSPILNEPRVFNAYFPSGIYCSDVCKNNNAPRFSEADLQKIANKIDELKKLKEDGTIQPFKSKVQDLRQEFLNALKRESRYVPFQELIRLIGFRNQFSSRWLRNVLDDLTVKGKVTKVMQETQCCYGLSTESREIDANAKKV